MSWEPDYCTAVEMKAFRRIDDAVDDTQIGLAITAASRAVDFATNRQFGKVAAAEARYFTASWSRSLCRWVVPIDDLMSTTNFALAVDLDVDSSYAHTITAYDLKPLNAAAKSRPWTEVVVRTGSAVTPNALEDAVRITALWGWTAVPDPVKQATLLQASRFLSRRDSPYGIAGSPDAGSELRLLARLDPDVELSLRKYVRWWGAV